MTNNLDLFKHEELQPKELKDLINIWFEKFAFEGTYLHCIPFLEEVQKLGYTFDYGNDYVPHSLRPFTDEANIEINKEIKLNEIISNEDIIPNLFQYIDLLPNPLSEILMQWSDKIKHESLNLAECNTLQQETNEIGYTFHYGVDAVPYHLRVMTDDEFVAYSNKTKIEKSILNKIITSFNNHNTSEAVHMIDNMINYNKIPLSNKGKSFILNSALTNSNKAFLISKFTNDKPLDILNEIENKPSKLQSNKEQSNNNNNLR